ncbi:hypothetical protein [Deminuibacter soli]|uniref:hypothetical protein n=1 Tax=Deminuibacter soli TaxID=2291815 RepID=UPI001314E568|nr:hypothetical protein [Deminuibacter soli]
MLRSNPHARCIASEQSGTRQGMVGYAPVAQGFAYRVSISWWGFVAAIANPVKNLKAA